MTSAKPASRRVDRDLVLLWLFALTPVLAWIAAQQLSFLASRSICGTGHRWVFAVVMGSALAATIGSGAASWMKVKQVRTYRRFMALAGVFLAAMCSLSIVSLMIPAALHRLCD